MKAPQIGSVSQATMRSEDLLPVFLDELREYNPERADEIQEDVDKLQKDADGYYLTGDNVYYLIGDNVDGLPSDEMADEIVNEDLFNALNEIAPPYCYFGSHPGDGADFGFWPDIDSIVMAIQDDEICQIEAGADPTPEQFEEYDFFVSINDHGNMTLFSKEWTLKEEWGVV